MKLYSSWTEFVQETDVSIYHCAAGKKKKVLQIILAFWTISNKNLVLMVNEGDQAVLVGEIKKETDLKWNS